MSKIRINTIIPHIHPHGVSFGGVGGVYGEIGGAFGETTLAEDVDTSNWSHNPLRVLRFTSYLFDLKSDSISKESIMSVAFHASSKADFTRVSPKSAANAAFGSSLFTFRIDWASFTSPIML